MKKLAFQILLTFISFTVHSQTFSATEAAQHEGETITVCGKVSGTHITKGDKKVIYINLDKPYPNNPFTIVIFEKSSENFDYNPLEFLKNKNICVSGKVSFYRDKPQIVANKQSQILIQK